MKDIRNKFILSALLGAIIFISSCNKDTEPAVSFSAGDKILFTPNETLSSPTQSGTITWFNYFFNESIFLNACNSQGEFFRLEWNYDTDGSKAILYNEFNQGNSTTETITIKNDNTYDYTKNFSSGLQESHSGTWSLEDRCSQLCDYTVYSNSQTSCSSNEVAVSIDECCPADEPYSCSNSSRCFADCVSATAACGSSGIVKAKTNNKHINNYTMNRFKFHISLHLLLACILFLSSCGKEDSDSGLGTEVPEIGSNDEILFTVTEGGSVDWFNYYFDGDGIRACNNLGRFFTVESWSYDSDGEKAIVRTDFATGGYETFEIFGNGRYNYTGVTSSGFTESHKGVWTEERRCGDVCNYTVYSGPNTGCTDFTYIQVSSDACCPPRTPFYCSETGKCYQFCLDASFACGSTPVTKGE